MTEQIEVTKIRVTNRARKDFGDIASLAKDISENGLINPITVHANPDGTYSLAAGERRLRAFVLLGRPTIPARLDTEIQSDIEVAAGVPRPDALKRKALELAENLGRQDFSWQERIECMRQYHELQRLIFGEPKGGTSSEGWGVRQTAAALGKSAGGVTMDLQLAETLRLDPALAASVKKLPMHAAKRIVKQVLEKRELDKQIKDKSLKLGIELKLGPCEQLVDTLEPESVDLLLTDPPFAAPDIVKASLSDTAMYNLNTTNVADITRMTETFQVLVPKLATKLKPGAHVYIFTGMGEMYYRQLIMLRDHGFLMDELPLIWNKEMNSVMARDYHYMSCYQACMFGHFKERTRSLWKPTKNIFEVTAPAHQNRVHPLQLPRELLQQFIRNSTSPGHLVLDCFAGSGSVLDAARSLNRRAIGFELDEGNYARALAWLQETENENERPKQDRAV